MKGTFAGIACTLCITWVVFQIYGNDLFRRSGDIVISLLSVFTTFVTQTIFVGRRKTGTSIVPVSKDPSCPVDEANGVGRTDGASDASSANTQDRSGNRRDQQAKARQLLFSSAVNVTYIAVYVFYVVPLYGTWSSVDQFLFRVFVHPMVLLTGEMALREVAVMPSNTSPLLKCTNIMGYDIYFQLVGRLLVAAQTNPFLANITIIVVSVQEFIMRISHIPKKKWMRRNLLRLPPMTAEEEGRFLGVLAIDNVSAMQVRWGESRVCRHDYLLTVPPYLSPAE